VPTRPKAKKRRKEGRGWHPHSKVTLTSWIWWGLASNKRGQDRKLNIAEPSRLPITTSELSFFFFQTPRAKIDKNVIVWVFQHFLHCCSEFYMITEEVIDLLVYSRTYAVRCQLADQGIHQLMEVAKLMYIIRAASAALEKSRLFQTSVFFCQWQRNT
jgi:hypothetical protein